MTDVYSVIRFEFIEKLKQKPIPDSVQNRLTVLQEFEEITIEDGQIKRKERQKRGPTQFSLINFFYKLGLHLFDTYLFVLLAVSEICNSNIEIREEKLVHELHQVIIKMHSQNLISQLHSCLKETIQTALARYCSMGMLVKKSYSNQQGGAISYFTSPLENKPKI